MNERKSKVKTTKKLNLTKDTVEAMFYNFDVAIMALDYESGEMLFLNEKVCIDLEIGQMKVEGQHYKNIFTTDFTKSYEKLIEDCGDGKTHTIIYYWAVKLIWEQVSAKLIKWEDERNAILLTITNVTDIVREEHKYEKLAYFDGVTGLPNGKRLEEDINKIVDTETVALIYFQIKGFYNINNLYGFDAGDDLIMQIKDWILQSERKSIQLYRDEHGLISLGHDVTLDDAILRTKQILERFNRPWTLTLGNNNLEIYCSIRIGIVYGKYVKNEMRNLLIRSLSAPVTEEGYSIYDEKFDKESKDTLILSQMLVNCVHDDMSGFSVSYQPIIKTDTEKWMGAEALCRWRTPEGENISPFKFINMSEKLGLICKVDKWVRESAMRDYVRWGLSEKDFFLDVNFSSMQIIDEKFVKDLMLSIDEIGYPIQKLVMEITESVKMEFNKQNFSWLKELSDKGVVLSLDDFGTGYSSFENLIKIPAINIKTEKIFLDGIETDKYKQYLLQMIIDLAHHQNMKIICEGVETEGQKNLLKKYGADYMQGYLFSKPLTKEEFEKEILRHNRSVV